DGCPWRLHTSLISDSTTVRISSFIDDHQCTRSIHGRGHSQTTQATLVAILPSYCPRDIKRDIQREMGVQINYKKAWCAKEHGISEINGSFEDAYKNSPNTATTSKRAIPSVLLLLTPPPMVDFVICFSASVRV